MGCLACAGFVKGMGEATRLILREPVPAPIQAPCLAPRFLAGRSEREIAALSVNTESGHVPLGDLFRIEPGLNDDVELEGDLTLFNGIGTSMAHGKLTVRGNAGDDLGSSMQGGTIAVEGDVGQNAGARMADGTIRILGNTGNELGAAMEGGLIAVRGNAGDRTGASMTGGTIFVFGSSGVWTGIENRHGTIVVLKDLGEPLSDYNLSCTQSPTILDRCYKQFREWGWDMPDGFDAGLFSRYVGDLNFNGKGEILVFNQSQ